MSNKIYLMILYTCKQSAIRHRAIPDFGILRFWDSEIALCADEPLIANFLNRKIAKSQNPKSQNLFLFLFNDPP